MVGFVCFLIFAPSSSTLLPLARMTLQHRSPQELISITGGSQWDLNHEIGEKALEEMPFYLALKISKGTVSVIDKEVRCWGRIWCKTSDVLLGPAV